MGYIQVRSVVVGYLILMKFGSVVWGRVLRMIKGGFNLFVFVVGCLVCKLTLKLSVNNRKKQKVDVSRDS